ncbi:MAG: DUF3073 domain-containing protein [Actinomycetaceae bacterium]|nr:DUF3073 domain-containing protein [Actinomycetaceae bacterium]
MGRGRQKAKQTKVARRLKYFSPDTDLDALQRELSSGHGSTSDDDPYDKYAVDEDEYDDPYADQYADDDGELDEDSWLRPTSSK